MDIFPGWGNHVEKIEANWNSKITDEDTVVLLGDHSWALKLEESYKDLEFIHSKLRGQKIFIKGNHDLWWSTMNKITKFVSDNGFSSIKFLFNNAYLVEGASICGTRGWISENGEKPDVVLGDVDGDGKIKTTDALLVLQHVSETITLEGNEFVAADVDKDGVIKTTDALLILQYVAENISSFD